MTTVPPEYNKNKDPAGSHAHRIHHNPMTPPYQEAREQDQARYCRYHEGFGNDTEECIDLRNVIEEIIRAG